jgi:hypothetical protein
MKRSLRRAFLLLATGVAAGCSATSVPMYGSDGKPYVYVDCSGMFHSLDDCYRVANRVCPNGYRLTNSVAPRSNPFGNLVIDCQDAAAPTTPAVAATPGAL